MQKRRLFFGNAFPYVAIELTIYSAISDFRFLL
jgi:hypothetical protein